MSSTIRIGNAQAFWGDRSTAAAELLAQEPGLDYLTLDYLAEVSMSLLASQREMSPLASQRERYTEAGYPRDFVEVARSLTPYWNSGGKCRLIANAGGLNPAGCARACAQALEEAGCRSLKIAVVSGDDALDAAQTAGRNGAPPEQATTFRHLESGRPISDVVDRLVTANAYQGAGPIAEALTAGADIVITGRIADPSLAVGPCLHHFGWRADDWDRLAGATVAGHLIECGTQATGGISTDWLDLPDPSHIGFPIVEVSEDGGCVVTKPAGTGGAATAATVKEQLLYEIGDPGAYLSPDVRVSFLSLQVEDLGNDRVRVSGAKGSPPPETLKVSATYRDGFWAAGTLTIIGRDASTKAQRCGEIVLNRVREAGFALSETLIECLSGSDSLGDVCVERTVVRVAAKAESRAALERFSKELMPLITAGPQGTTGYSAGRPPVHHVFRYWPCLIDRKAIRPQIEYLTTNATQTSPATVAQRPRATSVQPSVAARGTNSPRVLGDIALARSGDKGTSANVGVIGRRAEDYDFLKDWLTADRVAAHFSATDVTSVTRYELPNLGALNFILHGILKNPLRTDAQGKALGQMLLAMPLP
jgi:hypothetical protein